MLLYRSVAARSCVRFPGRLTVPHRFSRYASDLPPKSDGLHGRRSSSIDELYELSKPLRDINVHVSSKQERERAVEEQQRQIEKIEQNIRHLATPKQMKAYLDKYVIGQDVCKKTMVVAIYNHYLRVNDNMIRRLRKGELVKKRRATTRPGLMSEEDIPGAKEKAKLALEFSKGASSMESPELEKSNLILIGPSGSGKTLLARTMARVLNVPIVIQDCTSLTQAGYIGEDITDCVQKLFSKADYDIEQCERGIIVLDEVDKLAKRSVMTGAKDISGEGVQQSLLKLLEGSQVPVQLKKEDSGNAGAAAAAAAAASQDVAIDSSNILFIAMGAFVGLHEITAKRLAEYHADKKTNGPIEDNGPSLSALERVNPEDLVKFGMIPEFIGRLPIIATLKDLTAEDLECVLVKPRNSIIRQYKYTFSRLGIQLAVTGPALQSVAQLSLKNGTGARGLHSILSKLLLSANYDCPGSDISYVLIDSETIDEFASSLEGGKALDDFKPKYYRDHQHEEFLNTILKEDPLLESQLRDDLI
ncbi:DEKNAAC102584 [Brettanomyces naardenensis]|uniref:DEKNAAC102584 n=1 Tax=Brettanomyces naardenensis TaxID=13370 RepID=A0A448YKG7_BRENA|nr:DEKNAAC102584 [Brettanomyces naardenensis]